MTYSHLVDNLWITQPFFVGRVKMLGYLRRDSRGYSGFSDIDTAVYLHFVNIAVAP